MADFTTLPRLDHSIEIYSVAPTTSSMLASHLSGCPWIQIGLPLHGFVLSPQLARLYPLYEKGFPQPLHNTNSQSLGVVDKYLL